MPRESTKPSKAIFDDRWLASVQRGGDSWASEVLATLETTGQAYLSQLRVWFDRIPLHTAAKQHLRKRLENVQNDEHLGAVNELAWWALMRLEGLPCEPLHSSRGPMPDFRIGASADCFVEVSTLNPSKAEREMLEAEGSMDLTRAQADTVRRIAGKLGEEKRKQLRYAAEQSKPGVLAIFDYTSGSGFGTQFFRKLSESLLGQGLGFKDYPTELSALVYLERKVIDGRNAISREHSAIYYNPCALTQLSVGALPFLHQFALQTVHSDPVVKDSWLWL